MPFLLGFVAEVLLDAALHRLITEVNAFTRRERGWAWRPKQQLI